MTEYKSWHLKQVEQLSHLSRNRFTGRPPRRTAPGRLQGFQAREEQRAAALLLLQEGLHSELHKKRGGSDVLTFPKRSSLTGGGFVRLTSHLVGDEW